MFEYTDPDAQANETARARAGEMFVRLQIEYQDWEVPTDDRCQIDILGVLDFEVNGEPVIDNSFRSPEFTPGTGFIDEIALAVPIDTDVIVGTMRFIDNPTTFEITLPAR